MRILEIVPPWIKPWPTECYGAIERVVWELGKALSARGLTIDYATEDAEVTDKVRAGGYDYVHCHTPPQAALLRGLAQDYVATTHWSQHWNDTPEGGESRGFVDLAVGHLALCERVFSGRRCAVIGQGVNVEEISLRRLPAKGVREAKRILMVGTYQYGTEKGTTNPVERKRYRHGIRLLAELPDARLTIAGPGVDRMLWDICRDEGVERERVTLRGNLERKELIALMHESSVLLHAAAQEVVALVPLEAMAAGLPVICARPANEYGEAVLQYDHWEELPDKLARVEQDYAGIVKAGRAYAGAHTWDVVAEKAEAALDEWRARRQEEDGSG